MVWTNEKHNSYLDFLEESFVKQLHYSRSLHGCHPQVGMWKQCPFPQQSAGHNSSHQFPILQDDCVQKMNYKSNDLFLETIAKSGSVVQSPRLHNFTSAGKSSITTFPVPIEIVVSNDGIYLRSNTDFSGKSAVNSEQNPIIDSCNHSLGSCNAGKST
ncbi:Cold regulated protein 27, putative isoform 2 [Hibiscus syriacus]|uniref:Cold regulated protein 27, putative isoform 2 n=1 Tax=Hibiscus syriacus TaxID=106335 RepID=A0A6A3AWS3_HIBSY|nr:Cold regulated protein 27, putative isoform 2 [Hibiscus syriacus]